MLRQIANIVFGAVLWMPTAAGWSAEASAAAQPGSAGDAETIETIESIDVIGQRPDFQLRKMEDFILEIGEPVSNSRGYARWQGRLCVGVFNLPDAAIAQYIADKITVTALDVGLPTGSPGCQPNLQIIFSPDARELASRLVEESPLMFRPFGNTENTTQGLAALEQFKTSDAPVRWWQVTMVVDETGLPAMALPGLDTPNVRAIASHLRSTVSDAIWGSLIVVDASKLKNLQWPQLAEYLAMVSLAQIEPGAQSTNHDSILNLFSAEKPPLAMTDMDRTYLRALYEMDTMMLPHTQRGVFSSMMVRVQRELEAE
jgi:hypothetical protein